MGLLSKLKQGESIPVKPPASPPAPPASRLPRPLARPTQNETSQIEKSQNETSKEVVKSCEGVKSPPPSRVLPAYPAQRFPTASTRQPDTVHPVENHEPEKNSPPEISQPEKISPCKKCSSPIFWESISRDGKKLCLGCDPPAVDALLLTKWIIRIEPRAAGDDSHDDHHHTWERFSDAAEKIENEKVEAEKNESEKKTSGENFPVGKFGKFLPHWSRPDAEGWCHGVDVEGGEHYRHQSLLPRTDRFMGDDRGGVSRRMPESESDYLRRLEQYRRIREPSLRWLDETEAAWLDRCAAMDKAIKLMMSLAVPAV